MRVASAYRVSAHAFIFIAIVTMTLIFRDALYLPFIAAALILAADIIAVHIENRLARAAVACIPAVVLIFSNSVIGAIALAIPIAYSAAVIGAGRFSFEVWQLRSEARLLLIIDALVMFVSLLGMEGLFGDEYPLEPIYCCWAIVFIVVLLVFLMLRTARIGSVRSPEWHKHNLLWFFIPIAACIPLGLFGMYVFMPILKYVGIVLCAPFFALIYLGNLLLGKVFDQDLVDWESSIATEPPEYEFEEVVNDPSATGKMHEYFRKMVHIEISKEAMIIIGLVVLGLVLILLTVLAIIRGRRMRGEYLAEGATEDLDEEFGRHRRLRRAGKAGPGSAERVRFTYRQYLAFLRTHGIVPSKSNTSGEISEEAKYLLRETDELLRGLYRKARYGRESDVTEADAALAAETYLRLVNDKNIKGATERRQEERNARASQTIKL